MVHCDLPLALYVTITTLEETLDNVDGVQPVVVHPSAYAGGSACRCFLTQVFIRIAGCAAA